MCWHVLKPWHLPWLCSSLAVGLWVLVFSHRNKFNDTHTTRLLRGLSEIPYVKKALQVLRSYVEVGHLGKSRETWGLTLIMELKSSHLFSSGRLLSNEGYPGWFRNDLGYGMLSSPFHFHSLLLELQFGTGWTLSIFLCSLYPCSE